MSEETAIKKSCRKKEPKMVVVKEPKKILVKEPKKEKVKKKFKFIPLTRDELLSKTSFTITWD